MGPTGTNRLATRVARALAEPKTGALDELLTDCAAEALAIRAGISGRQRLLDELLVGAPPDVAASEEVSSLTSRNQRAWEEWRELSALIGKVRARRDSLAEAADGPAELEQRIG